MDDLPSSVPTNIPLPQPGQSPTAPQAEYPVAIDPKSMLAQAIEQIDGVIAETPVNPFERAEEIHAVKAVYVKSVFGVDSKANAR